MCWCFLSENVDTHDTPVCGVWLKPRVCARAFEFPPCAVWGSTVNGRVRTGRDRFSGCSNQLAFLLELSPKQIPSFLVSILKRYLISRRTARYTRCYNHTEHPEIKTCGNYGGPCATTVLLWEGTGAWVVAAVGGCLLYTSPSPRD